MSKEIKFRAWDKVNKIMTYNSINAINFDGEILLNDGKFHDINKTDYILMQYTNLKDKNGKEIYEGDIVFSESNQYYKQDEIVWDCYDMGWDIGKKDCWKLRSPMSSKTEIIGNIYENPELMGGGNG
jgi:uncharacterized phage protein (TIGR01671 family)